MIKLQKLNSNVQYEKVNDFARESFIGYIEGYYLKSNEIVSCKNIPLYVKMPEDVTHIYYLTTSSSDWIRSTLEFEQSELIVPLSEKFMYKFDLVRVIPQFGHVPFDSFLRVMLKNAPENVRLISIEEEFYGDEWMSKNK